FILESSTCLMPFITALTDPTLPQLEFSRLRNTISSAPEPNADLKPDISTFLSMWTKKADRSDRRMFMSLDNCSGYLYAKITYAIFIGRHHPFTTVNNQDIYALSQIIYQGTNYSGPGIALSVKDGNRATYHFPRNTFFRLNN